MQTACRAEPRKGLSRNHGKAIRALLLGEDVHTGRAAWGFVMYVDDHANLTAFEQDAAELAARWSEQDPGGGGSRREVTLRTLKASLANRGGEDRAEPRGIDLRGIDLAHALAKRLCPARGSECFTAGFLQDMALPFLATQDPENYGPILEQWHHDGGNLCELERSVFDWDHAEVATWMCDEWDFPESIAAAMGGHHGAHYEGHEPLVPVRLVALLGETEESLGVETLMEEARIQCDIHFDTMKELITSSFEKGYALAELIP